LAEELTRVLEQARIKEQIRLEVDTRQAGLLLAVGYFASLAAWIAVEPEPFDIRQYLIILVDLVVNGLVEEPTRGA
jgi:hypothetical protein